MKKIPILLIKGYQATWPIREPFVRMFTSPEALECRFSPTCSKYTIAAIEKYGTSKGTWMGLKRVLKCRPGNPGGEDPLV